MTRRPTRSPIAAVRLSESPDSRTSRKTCLSSPWHKHGKRRQCALSSLLCLALLAISACHSYHIDATIVNRTGMPVHLLEVDYPDASFGADIIASGASFHYRFQIRGSGALKITYTGADNKQIQITGPTLDERQQGRLRIILLPNGKSQFLPELTSANAGSSADAAPDR